ncbi:hypothetical protein ACHAXS_000818 [Conticribra weissflogii]
MDYSEKISPLGMASRKEIFCKSKMMTTCFNLQFSCRFLFLFLDLDDFLLNPAIELTHYFVLNFF